MINSFKSFLVEEEKTVYFTFGRMNPPTIGHEKLLSVLAKKAGNNPYRIYLSHSQDEKKNPLQYKDKVKFARKMFPKYARSIILNDKIKTALHAAVSMYDEGYNKIVMVVGEPEVRQFDVLLNRYNGEKSRHGFYNFEKITVESAGKRNPDAEGTEGMSATKVRAAATNGDFTKFSQSVPTTLRNADTKALYNAVRRGMGLKEENQFRNHISLQPVSEEREQYVRGNLYDIGNNVVIKEDSSIATVTFLGSNYVIVEQNGMKFRKWLTDIEVLENTVDQAKERISREQDVEKRKDAADRKRHDAILDRARMARTRKINRRTSQV